MSIMQDLYDSEINVTISVFWDGGFNVRLGDSVNGFKAEGVVLRWGEVEPWLKAAALEHFPESDFARVYRDGLPTYRVYSHRVYSHKTVRS